jgi:16S rRNA (uracil1498-N3)-methyltransferase
MHTLLLSDVGDSDRLTVTGDERAHAVKVKRVREGDRVRVLNGRGLVLVCEVEFTGRELGLRVLERKESEPAHPHVHVFAPAPKGGRAGDMVDMLCQVGAASWTPLRTEFSGPEITEAKLARMERVVDEAIKQCLRPWRMEVRPPVELLEALAAPEAEPVILAHQDGERSASPLAGDSCRILVGPEGGFTDEEIAQARNAGASIRCFGPHVLRVEVAAVVGAAWAISSSG